MDAELLRTFLVVLRTRSFTAAARELGYVQSTVTGHVQTLERRLGVRLLDRLPSGAVPTDAGLRLRPYAEQLLDLQARLLTDVPDGPDRPAGPVRLAAPESLCAYRLPHLITALRIEHHGLRVTLTPAGTAAALEALRAGTTDLALLLEPALTAPDLQLERIGEEQIQVLAAPTSGIDLTRPSTWADLAATDALLLEEGCSYSDDTVRHLLAAGQPATRRTRFGSIEAIKRCAAAGLGWTALPAVTSAGERDAGTLAALPGPALPACSVYLGNHRARSRSAATEHVTAGLRALWSPP